MGRDSARGCGGIRQAAHAGDVARGGQSGRGGRGTRAVVPGEFGLALDWLCPACLAPGIGWPATPPPPTLDGGVYHRRWEIETTLCKMKVRHGLEGSLRRPTPQATPYEAARRH